MTTAQALEKLNGTFGSAVGNPVEFRGETTVTVARERLVEICRMLHDSCGYDMLTDLSGTDNYGEDPRFQIDYLLYSLANGCHLRLKVRVPEEDAAVDTVTPVWRTADWHEREAWDMLGIRFNGHPNLKRILMWEGYPHHPLRKDFPLAGLPADFPDYGSELGATAAAPMVGGPFVPGIGSTRTADREPRQGGSAGREEGS